MAGQKRKVAVYDWILCALFTALIAVGAFLKIPTPLVPITLQTLFVALAGLLLGKKAGISACLYVALGLIGIPIFTAGGGFDYIFKPTFGYLLGFCVGAFLTGLMTERIPHPSFRQLLVASFAGLAVIYLMGGVYYYFMTRFYTHSPIALGTLAVNFWLLPLPGDIISMIAAALLAKRLLPILNKKR